MRYLLSLFSPDTYEAFSASDRQISGYRVRHRNAAARVSPGDRFLCYLTRLGRWIGILEVIEGPFEDSTPVFVPGEDPFSVRFKVRPIAWVEKEFGVPIRESEIWSQLSFTREHQSGSTTWTGKIRTSLTEITAEDALVIEAALSRQLEPAQRIKHEIDDSVYRRLLGGRIRTPGGDAVVSIPDDDTDEPESAPQVSDRPERESAEIQALLARIGAQMGMRIWIPANDRLAVSRHWIPGAGELLERLPLNYDETTLGTIERIDVLWLKGRSIVRAFEVEHTTAVYSGILRMADLLALQPNMDIDLHIVAPTSRRAKVFQEITRPVFTLLERGPLSSRCSFISYESLRELQGLRHLSHLSDTVLDEYAEDPTG